MVLTTVRGDIFDTACKHIIFAINMEGVNDAGFAGRVSSDLWPEIRYMMPSPLGMVIKKEIVDGRMLYAIVCHSLCADGWKKTPEVLEKCFQTEFTDVSDDETIASVQIGGGLIGDMMGADTAAIREVMERSPKNFLLYIR